MTWQETQHLSDYSSVFGIAWAPDFFARVFIGYLIYDMAVMVWYKELQDPTAILHHFIFVMAAVYVVAHSIMAYPFSWLAFTEVSTPFLNIRYASQQYCQHKLVGLLMLYQVAICKYLQLNALHSVMEPRMVSKA